jgi:hypothetical protein
MLKRERGVLLEMEGFESLDSAALSKKSIPL